MFRTDNQINDESKRIYFDTLKTSLGSECIEIIIKENKIHKLNESHHNPWKQRKIAYTTLIEDTLKDNIICDSVVRICLGDQPKTGHFNFCRVKNKSGYFMVPNFRFFNDNIVNTKYYEFETNSLKWDDVTKYIFDNDKNFLDKQSSFYMCGGLQDHTKYNRQTYFNKIETNNLFKGHVWKGGADFKHFSEHFDYKFPVYMDGATNSDRFRLLMCLNAVPFYCSSPYEEFYTYLLQPNENYIEVPNVDHLEEKYNHIKDNLDFQKNIINNNKKFVCDVLTYDNILRYTADIVNELYR